MRLPYFRDRVRSPLVAFLICSQIGVGVGRFVFDRPVSGLFSLLVALLLSFAPNPVAKSSPYVQSTSYILGLLLIFVIGQFVIQSR